MPTTVHITDQGNQTISGNKIFDDSIIFSSGVTFLRNAGTADTDIDLLSRPFLNSRVSIGTDTGILGQSINTLNNEREIKIWETGGAVTAVGYGPYIRIGRSGVLISEKTESKVGVGTLFPTEKVHISGGNLKVEGNAIAQTGSFNTISITNKKISSYNYSTGNFIFGDNYINITNSSTNITGTLPSGITSGINYYVKNLNTGILLITGSGQRTIDGFSTVNLYRNESLQLLGVNNVGYTGWVTFSADNGVS
jgi:hypothetical protein